MTDIKIKSNKNEIFKTYLKKIGSGEVTGKSLTREESADALDLMLNGCATEAQIGGFLIAQRIRRPTPEELAGMLDTYHNLGPTLISKENKKPPICIGMPFDGRNRTAPIYPLTALVLLSERQPVIMHGGKRMPTKYGVTINELFYSIGLDIFGLSIQDLQEFFNDNDLGIINQPDHFPLADKLITFRDQIGKRPPIASLELIWTPHRGRHKIISGFVHSPTVERGWKALHIHGEKNLVFIKGLEGSIDLPISKKTSGSEISNEKLTKLNIDSREFKIYGKDQPWINIKDWSLNAKKALNNDGPFLKSLIWNAGYYLWITETYSSLNESIKAAEKSIASNKPKDYLNKLIESRNNQNNRPRVI
tara:strand:- start:2059 stop:3147 length:1089 start_codon:yes stop_codon:yes gene_type:complete